MANHQKPTKEELEASIKASAEQIEKEAQEIVSPSLEVPEDNKPKEQEEEVKPSEEVPGETPEVIEEVKPEVKPEEKSKEQIDRERLIASQREALILNARQKKMDEAVELADNLPEPMQEDLEKEATSRGFTLEEMTAVEKSLFKTTIINERKLSLISSVAKEGRDINEWNKKVDEFTEDPQTFVEYPKLEGKAAEFKLFSSKQTRRGIPFDVLVGAFLHDETTKLPPKQKTEMFPSGTIGGAEVQKDKKTKMTVEQGKVLMASNFKEYLKQLQAGNIEME